MFYLLAAFDAVGIQSNQNRLSVQILAEQYSDDFIVEFLLILIHDSGLHCAQDELTNSVSLHMVPDFVCFLLQIGIILLLRIGWVAL